jgi:hypothetical protein
MTGTTAKERLVNIAVVLESNPKEQEKMVKKDTITNQTAPMVGVDRGDFIPPSSRHR